MVWERLVPRRTAFSDSDRHFNNLKGSHLLTLKITSPQVVKMSVSVTSNGPSHYYSQLDNHTRQITETPGLTSVTKKRLVGNKLYINNWSTLTFTAVLSGPTRKT